MNTFSIPSIALHLTHLLQFKIRFLNHCKRFSFIWIIVICIRARLPGGSGSGKDDRDRNEHRPSELLAWNPRVPRRYHQERQASRREL